MNELTSVVGGYRVSSRVGGRGVQVFLCVALMALPRPARADVISLGTLAFETGIIGGLNSFVIGNFTGAESAPPDFPVLTPLTFLNVSVVVTHLLPGPTDTINLPLLGPGQHVTISFGLADLLSQAQFTATILSPVFALAGGGTFVPSTTSITAALFPSAGATLEPGDVVSIDIEGTPRAAPEPASVVLLIAGAAALALSRWHRSRRA